MIQVNYLSTILLARLMLPVLRQITAGRTTPGRLVISNASLALAAQLPNKDKNRSSTPQNSTAPPICRDTSSSGSQSNACLSQT